MHIIEHREWNMERQKKYNLQVGRPTNQQWGKLLGAQGSISRHGVNPPRPNHGGEGIQSAKVWRIKAFIARGQSNRGNSLRHFQNEVIRSECETSLDFTYKGTVSIKR